MLVAMAMFAGAAAWIAHDAAIVRQRFAHMPLFDNRSYCLTPVGTRVSSPKPTLPWLRRMLGDYPIDVLFYSPRMDPDGTQLLRVRNLFPEAEIWGWPVESPENLPDGVKPWPKNRYFMI
jgi:hypothetical protein